MVKILLRQLQSIATLLVFQIVSAILSPVAAEINHACNFGKPLAGKTVVGYLEHAWFAGNKISFEAKLDTGAQSSSINSARSERFKRDGEDWVRLDLTNRENQSIQLVIPVKKTVRIRRAGTKTIRRDVVDLTICVAGHTAKSEFTLADRGGQSYQILIGRKFMKDKLLVDPANTYLFPGRCKNGEKP